MKVSRFHPLQSLIIELDRERHMGLSIQIPSAPVKCRIDEFVNLSIDRIDGEKLKS